MNSGRLRLGTSLRRAFSLVGRSDLVALGRFSLEVDGVVPETRHVNLWKVSQGEIGLGRGLGPHIFRPRLRLKLGIECRGARDALQIRV